MATVKRSEGPTPSGGVRAEAYFRDDDWQPADESVATTVEVVEYDRRGNAVQRTHASIGGATQNAFCPTGEGGGVDPSCSPGGKGGKGGGRGKKAPKAEAPKEEVAKEEVAKHRPSKPEERDPDATVPIVKDKLIPPAPMSKSKAPKNAEGKPITGYSANGIANTFTGDVVENALSKLDMRSILPEGKRSHAAGEVEEKGSSMDREHDHSGEFFEVKTVCVEATEYKAGPKGEEIEAKKRFTEMHEGTGNTMIVVMDTDKLEAHAYWRPGIGAFKLRPDDEKNMAEWHYAGTVKLDKAVVEEARRKTKENQEKRVAEAERKKGKEVKAGEQAAESAKMTITERLEAARRKKGKK